MAVRDKAGLSPSWPRLAKSPGRRSHDAGFRPSPGTQIRTARPWSRFREPPRGPDQDGLEELRVEFLGRKGGWPGSCPALPDLPPEERPEAGQAGQSGQRPAAGAIEAKRRSWSAWPSATPSRSHFDPTLPGPPPWKGGLHPVTLVTGKSATSSGLGYEVVTGPEVENDFYNFEALNIPRDHPARDMQDTLYVDDSIVLAPTPPPCRSDHEGAHSRPWRPSPRARSTAGTPT